MEVEEPPPEPEKDRSERWLLTYADLITLLLIFFIIMYVMSVQDVAKYAALRTSLIEAFTGSTFVVGSAPGPGAISGGGQPGAHGAGMGSEQEQMESIDQSVEELARMEELETEMTTSVGDEGVRIRLAESMMFSSGRADLSAQAYRVLQEVGQLLARYPSHQVRIEGHTDSTPMYSAMYPSNWELSGARAASVLRTLTQGTGLDPKLLWLAGYAEQRPVADNRTDGGRRANRRVEIVVLRNGPPSLRQVAAEAARPNPQAQAQGERVQATRTAQAVPPRATQPVPAGQAVRTAPPARR